ncbi:tRNA (adenosine(37)-N6)-threonylcarbamoyltransferase complex transferase subunit TsaD [Candidatus Methylomirabilis limnetica]|jgi:N6-L-threonylcarbamoyladenine synthase|uniref:tRNA N6-adenosine threonylcarbamoyltransferase n=1 Tax=Candidatus Methylomirabilis limnetica TaxID=2033718 RepID=A0A2T4TVP4_9BACT|nr:tRNA (adenosine(37)-N6)-threonylcarbamoyltransferase complex transferase subunit TsaD [Candidatus Methylomirabilis limnetica]PTL35148.1 tRNA (adenosine(37)-N6)-threonylcarbamoyltransferase complex transferase subunit TsaD [Candidatus Methylomirabilis limnetica]
MAHLTLGIETSCDETAAAVLEDGRRIRSSVIASQDTLHAPFGGVVPELASRRHVEVIWPVVQEALARAGVTLAELDGIAATAGPGLIGSLLVGLCFGKALAFARNIPLVGVNHLEGHLYAATLDHEGLSFPFTGLVASGGHTNLYLATAPGVYRLLGRTRDDAAGEAFDKVAKLLSLGYPGGPLIEEWARKGDPNAVRFPRSVPPRGSYDFSFSGLKTAVVNYVKGVGGAVLQPSAFSLQPDLVADICAGFQEAVVDVLVRVSLAAAKASASRRLVLVGGVACNGRLRSKLTERAAEEGVQVYYPKPSLCTDNAAMIAAAGYPRLLRGERSLLSLNADANLTLGLT